jgi:hypothetical protein
VLERARSLARRRTAIGRPGGTRLTLEEQDRRAAMKAEMTEKKE